MGQWDHICIQVKPRKQQSRQRPGGTPRAAPCPQLGSGVGRGGFLGGLRWAASIMGLALVWRLWSPEHRENEVWDFGVRVEGLHVQSPLQEAVRYYSDVKFEKASEPFGSAKS